MIAILTKDCPLAHKAGVVRLIEEAGCRVVVSETQSEICESIRSGSNIWSAKASAT